MRYETALSASILSLIDAESLLADLKKRTKDFAPTKNHQVYYALFLKQRPNDGKKDYVLLPEDIINDLE